MQKYLLITTLIIGSTIVQAHPGGTNADGCHTNKATGEFHCHKPKKQPASSPEEKTTETNPLSRQTEITRSGKLLKLDYEGFTVWLDCEKRGAVKFQYNAQHDTGNEARAKNFKFDPNVPAECQQTSAKGYGHGYDRGHQVPANHLDYSPVAIKQSNYMTNILPQTSQMNRGAWLLTEEIIECYRDIDELLVIGGVIWGNNPHDASNLLPGSCKPKAFRIAMPRLKCRLNKSSSRMDLITLLASSSSTDISRSTASATVSGRTVFCSK